MSGQISKPENGANSAPGMSGAMLIPRNRLLSSAQCRAARALLGWTQAQLAAKAGVARRTLVHFEAGRRSLLRRTLADITGVLETEGVELVFLDEIGGAGVRIRTSRSLAGTALGDSEPPTRTVIRTTDAGAPGHLQQSPCAQVGAGALSGSTAHADPRETGGR